MDSCLDDWNNRLTDDVPGQDYEPLVLLITGMQERQLVQHLSRVLPLSLRLLDHHFVPNKSLGVRAVSHLMQTLPVQTLSSTGSDHLLMHSLKSCLAHEELLLEVLPVLILAMRRTGTDPVSETADEILLTIVRGLDLSTSLKSKRIYWKSLHLVTEFVGLAVVRLSKRIVKRMADHLSYPLTKESEEMFHELLVTSDNFVKVTSERADRFCPEILFTVCSFCYSNHQPLRSSDRIREDVLTLIHSLSQVHPASFQQAMHVMARNDPEDRMSLIFKQLDCHSQTAGHQEASDATAFPAEKVSTGSDV